jgi:hypothetical protein
MMFPITVPFQKLGLLSGSRMNFDAVRHPAPRRLDVLERGQHELGITPPVSDALMFFGGFVFENAT